MLKQNRVVRHKLRFSILRTGIFFFFSFGSRIRNELRKGWVRVSSSWKLAQWRELNREEEQPHHSTPCPSASWWLRQVYRHWPASLPIRPWDGSWEVPLPVLETGIPQHVVIFSFLTNEIRYETCCVNFKGLITVVRWFLLRCLEFHSFTRGRSLNFFGTGLNPTGCLWASWLGHTQVFKYSYNLQLITVSLLTA